MPTFEISLQGGVYAGAEICARSAHHEREALSPLRPGSRARPRALVAQGVLDALWCNLSCILEHFCTTFLTNISEIIFVNSRLQKLTYYF